MDMLTNRGSVLMEFIIVLPLYFVLLGMVFLFGDLSLHAVNMAASGDRTYAVSHGMSEDPKSRKWTTKESEPYVKGALSLSSNNEEVVSTYTDNKAEIKERASRFSDGDDVARGIVAEDSFKGSWTWLVGATLTDDYALAPITRMFVRTWSVFAGAATMSDPNWESDREYASGSPMKRLFPASASKSDSLGRLDKMVSKDDLEEGGVKRYAYYTLMRNGKGRKSCRHPEYLDDESAGSYLQEGGMAWKKYVSDEEYFFDGEDYDEDYKSLKKDNRSGANGVELSGISPYQRYKQFKKWSH